MVAVGKYVDETSALGVASDVALLPVIFSVVDVAPLFDALPVTRSKPEVVTDDRVAVGVRLKAVVVVVRSVDVAADEVNVVELLTSGGVGTVDLRLPLRVVRGLQGRPLPLFPV